MAQTEVKVTTSTLGSLGASLALALLNATAADSSILGGLPAWAQFIVLAVLPPLITFFSGYSAPSSTSTVSDGYTRRTAA
jgi:hypothetical protein